MEPKHINLALQGGGAHGAFAWGVLDRLLDEDWLIVDGISGTSAGALNGAAVKAGLALGNSRAGRKAAKKNLTYIWENVSQVSDNRMIRWLSSNMMVPRGMQRWAELFTPTAWLEGMTRVFSPYDYGPLYSNPLLPILKSMPHPVFWGEGGPRLFINATNVRTGRIRVFTGTEATCEAVTASACLPTLFRAVEIDDAKTGRREAYWDGGYSGNPALYPLFAPALPRDIVIVNINPMMREALPKTPAEIQDRINEVSFNSSLLRELRAINFVKKLWAEQRINDRQMKNPLIHMIMDDVLMNDLNARSKLLPNPQMLERMRKAGQAAADAFLADHADDLNNQDTVDLPALFS